MAESKRTRNIYLRGNDGDSLDETMLESRKYRCSSLEKTCTCPEILKSVVQIRQQMSSKHCSLCNEDLQGFHEMLYLFESKEILPESLEDRFNKVYHDMVELCQVLKGLMVINPEWTKMFKILTS